MNIPPVVNGQVPGYVTAPAAIRAATADGKDRLGTERVDITYNFEPSRRLRFCQFDPTRHDVAVFSVH